MSFTVAAFITRKADLSPADFQSAYEAHVPFLQETIGEAGTPDSVTRHYVRRAKSDPQGLKPLTFTGSEETFGYDLVVFMNFKDEQTAQVFQQNYEQNKEKIGAKVAEFADLEKFRVVAFEDAITSSK